MSANIRYGGGVDTDRGIIPLHLCAMVTTASLKSFSPQRVDQISVLPLIPVQAVSHTKKTKPCGARACQPDTFTFNSNLSLVFHTSLQTQNQSKAKVRETPDVCLRQ